MKMKMLLLVFFMAFVVNVSITRGNAPPGNMYDVQTSYVIVETNHTVAEVPVQYIMKTSENVTDVVVVLKLEYLISDQCLTVDKISVPVEVVSRSGVNVENYKSNSNYNITSPVLTDKNYTKIGYSIWN
jgi:hypothetical protein